MCSTNRAAPDDCLDRQSGGRRRQPQSLLGKSSGPLRSLSCMPIQVMQESTTELCCCCHRQSGGRHCCGVPPRSGHLTECCHCQQHLVFLNLCARVSWSFSRRRFLCGEKGTKRNITFLVTMWETLNSKRDIPVRATVSHCEVSEEDAHRCTR